MAYWWLLLAGLAIEAISSLQVANVLNSTDVMELGEGGCRFRRENSDFELTLVAFFTGKCSLFK